MEGRREEEEGEDVVVDEDEDDVDVDVDVDDREGNMFLLPSSFRDGIANPNQSSSTARS